MFKRAAQMARSITVDGTRVTTTRTVAYDTAVGMAEFITDDHEGSTSSQRIMAPIAAIEHGGGLKPVWTAFGDDRSAARFVVREHHEGLGVRGVPVSAHGGTTPAVRESPEPRTPPAQPTPPARAS